MERCLFTCLAMRAVHIEVVPKLDTDICLNAIIRFIAQRGKPSTITSNNSTNFVEGEQVCTVRCDMEQIRDRRKFNSTSNQMEILPTTSTSLPKIMGTVGCMNGEVA